MKTAWPRVLRGIAGWAGAVITSAVVLPDTLRVAFYWGVAGLGDCYLSLYVIRYPLLRRRER